MPSHKGFPAASELCCYRSTLSFRDHLALEQCPDFLKSESHCGGGACTQGCHGDVDPAPAFCILEAGRAALSPLETLDMLSEPAWFVWVPGSPCSQEEVGHCSIYFGEIETSDLRVDVPEDRHSPSRQGKIQRCLRSAQDSGLAGWPSDRTPRGVCAPGLHLSARSLLAACIRAGPRGVCFPSLSLTSAQPYAANSTSRFGNASRNNLFLAKSR